MIESVRASMPKLTLDRMREFGHVCPPETLLCAGGRSIPAALREENPSEFQLFHTSALADRVRVVAKVRCYEQDGFSFDADGILIEETLDELARERALRAEAERQARIIARRAHADAMRAAGYPEGSFVDIEDAPRLTPSDVGVNPADTGPLADRPAQMPKVDLIGWARGQVQVQFFAVKKAFREQHGFDPRGRAEALDFLVENGLISAGAVA